MRVALLAVSRPRREIALAGWLWLALASNGSLASAQATGVAAPAPTSEAPATAAAALQAADREGRVIAVQGNDVIVDLSEGQGIVPAVLVELWRPLKLKHPVTGRMIEDRFRIGQLSVRQVRPHMSLAVAEGTLDRTPEPGDIVIARAARPSGVVPVLGEGIAAAPAPAAPPAATATSVAEAGDAQALSRLFAELQGATPRARIEAYARFVQEHPNNRFAPALKEQARELRRLLETKGKASPASSAAGLAHHQRPRLALVGDPLSIGVELDGPAPGVVVHYKSSPAAVFQSLAAQPAGPRYFVATIPGEAVQLEGLEYFVEVVDNSGHPSALVGTSKVPMRVPTRADWDYTPPRRPTATAQFVADYADYNRLKANDRDYRLEADFGLRLRDTELRALRSGFGVYRGVGGTLIELDELGKSPRKVGLTYGYLEAEYAFRETFSLIARTLLGLDDNGVSSGLQAHVRIGSDQATNVTIGGEVLGDIGVRGITQLTIAPLSTFPIVLRSEVGNQPAGVVVSDFAVRPLDENASIENTSTGQSDVGVRGIAQLGYRILPDLVLNVRASYQGRNIKHSGPGFGGGVLYSW
jgi:hypothetical protein